MVAVTIHRGGETIRLASWLGLLAAALAGQSAALGDTNQPADVQPRLAELRKQMLSGEHAAERQALDELYQLGPAATAVLAEGVYHVESHHRVLVAGYLTQLGPQAIPALITCIGSAELDEDVFDTCIRGLQDQYPDSHEALVRALTSADLTLQRNAIKAVIGIVEMRSLEYDAQHHDKFRAFIVALRAAPKPAGANYKPSRVGEFIEERIRHVELTNQWRDPSTRPATPPKDARPELFEAELIVTRTSPANVAVPIYFAFKPDRSHSIKLGAFRAAAVPDQWRIYIDGKRYELDTRDYAMTAPSGHFEFHAATPPLPAGNHEIRIEGGIVYLEQEASLWPYATTLHITAKDAAISDLVDMACDQARCEHIQKVLQARVNRAPESRLAFSVGSHELSVPVAGEVWVRPSGKGDFRRAKLLSKRAVVLRGEGSIEVFNCVLELEENAAISQAESFDVQLRPDPAVALFHDVPNALGGVITWKGLNPDPNNWLIPGDTPAEVACK